MYFGDGLLQDSGATGYRPEWDFVDAEGRKVVSGWTGPDTWGQTFARNPAHPQVRRWYQDYLAALLKAYGPVVDGFVWDETFYIRTAATTRPPQPAYCDRAMLTLVKALTAQVRAADPQKVFLASDCLGGVRDERPRLCPRRRRNVSGHGMRPRGLALWAVPCMAQRALELQLVVGDEVRRYALGRGALRRAGGHLQRLGRRPGALEVDAAGSGEDPCAVPSATGRQGAGAVFDGGPGDR